MPRGNRSSTSARTCTGSQAAASRQPRRAGPMPWFWRAGRLPGASETCAGYADHLANLAPATTAFPFRDLPRAAWAGLKFASRRRIPLAPSCARIGRRVISARPVVGRRERSNQQRLARAHLTMVPRCAVVSTCMRQPPRIVDAHQLLGRRPLTGRCSTAWQCGAGAMRWTSAGRRRRLGPCGRSLQGEIGREHTLDETVWPSRPPTSAVSARHRRLPLQDPNVGSVLEQHAHYQNVRHSPDPPGPVRAIGLSDRCPVVAVTRNCALRYVVDFQITPATNACRTPPRHPDHPQPCRHAARSARTVWRALAACAPGPLPPPA